MAPITRFKLSCLSALGLEVGPPLYAVCTYAAGLALLQDLDLGFGLLILGLELAHVFVRRTAQVLHHSVPLSGPSLIQNRSDGPVRAACIWTVNLAQTLLMLHAKDMCIAKSMLVQPAVGRALLKGLLGLLCAAWHSCLLCIC